MQAAMQIRHRGVKGPAQINVHMLKGAPDDGLRKGWGLSHHKLTPLASITLSNKQLHITIQTTPMKVLLHASSQLTGTSMP
jgi:hypothetical protein